MKIIDLNDERDLSKVEDSVGVALGNFDGVHRGHGKLIGEMIEGSKKRGLKSSVLLFKNHTKILLDKNSNIKVLTSNEEKINILNEMGVDIVYLIDFDRKLMELSGEDFIKKILLDKMKVKYITVGFDYRFGHRAGSTSKDLYNYSLDYGFEANIVDAIYVDEELISSTSDRRTHCRWQDRSQQLPRKAIFHRGQSGKRSKQRTYPRLSNSQSGEIRAFCYA